MDLFKEDKVEFIIIDIIEKAIKECNKFKK